MYNTEKRWQSRLFKQMEVLLFQIPPSALFVTKEAKPIRQEQVTLLKIGKQVMHSVDFCAYTGHVKPTTCEKADSANDCANMGSDEASLDRAVFFIFSTLRLLVGFGECDLEFSCPSTNPTSYSDTGKHTPVA